jgi:hypothetical protein
MPETVVKKCLKKDLSGECSFLFRSNTSSFAALPLYTSLFMYFLRLLLLHSSGTRRKRVS